MQSLPDICHNTLENQISSLQPKVEGAPRVSHPLPLTRGTLLADRRKHSKHITYTTHAPSRTPLISLLQHNTARTQQDGLNPRGGAQSWHHRQGWQYSCWSLQFDRWCWYLLTTNGPSTCWQCAEHLPPKEDTATKRWLQQSLDAFLYHCAHKGTFNHRFSPWRSPLTENVDYTAREMQFRRTEQLRQRRQGSSSLAGRARHASPVHETVMYTRAGRS